MFFTVGPERYSAPPVETWTMPSEPASAKPCSAALSVCDDDTLMAGKAKSPLLAASSISAYFSGVAIGMTVSLLRRSAVSRARRHRRTGPHGRAPSACIAIAAAAEALIDRVDPNCAIENVASQASRAASESPGPSWPNRKHTRRGTSVVSRCSEPGRLSMPHSAHRPAALVAEVRRQRRDVLVVDDVLVAVGDHRAAPVPPPVADDVHLARRGTRSRSGRWCRC